MKNLLFIMAFFVSAQMFSQADIVGGEDCEITDYPWQAAISIASDGGWYYSCGASVINEYWILTAAHCVVEQGQVSDPEYVTVTVGTTYSYGGVEYEADEVIKHPNYSGGWGGSDNDIALIKTKKSIEFNDNVQPIALMCANQVSSGAQYPGVMTTITGWGNTTQGGEGSDILQYIEVPIVDYDDPNLQGWMMNSVNPNTEIIAGLVDGGMDSCQGDSGGPMAVRNVQDTEWLLAGITSWGDGCAQSGRPGVYTKVSNYISWINTNTDGCVNGNLSTACNPSNDIPGCTDSEACNYNPEAENNVCCIYSSDPLYDCDGDCINNTDGDPVCDEEDNCPENTNFSQSDSDSDGVGNACDNCINEYNPSQIDTDNDGTGDACDDNLDLLESNTHKTLLKKIDIYGREIDAVHKHQTIIYIYSDGTKSKAYRF